ncbi:MAG TPA: dihydropteroate synthase, partial [Spirochaetia bacterium]|nr:dihydropteroate synthase [Spirochaetia bacterium]
ETALDLGADMVNDISSLKSDGELKHLIARRGIPVVLMHMRGTPKTMQQNPVYEDTLEEVRRELKNSIDEALKAGIAKDRIIIDPGIGFGKRLEDNLRIINCLEELKSLNHPILIGLSRKSFLGSILDLPVEERLIGTVTANTIAIIRGANIIRVHDPREAIQMARVADAVLRVPR